MRVIATAILGAALGAVPLSQTTQDGRPSSSLERAFSDHGRIAMDLSAGDYRISGSPDKRIRMEWSVRKDDQLTRYRAQADVRNNEARLVTDGPRNSGFKVLIQVPRQSDLHIRLTAGDLRVDGIEGNKDVELYAGDLRIDVGRADDYKSVDASVWAGEIQAAPFQVFKGGLFRSFDWRGHGPYRLHAKLKAGDLRLFTHDAEAKAPR